MPWDINQINQAFLGQVLGNSPAQAFDAGRLQAKEERIFDENRAAAIEAARQKALAEQKKVADRELLGRNPTPENYRAYFLAYPEDRESTKAAWDNLSVQNQQSHLRTLHDLRGYLSTGKYNEAANSLRARIEADKAAGEDVADDEAMLAQIVSNPKGALGVVDYVIASVSDPTKTPEGIKTLGENQRASELQPGLVRKGMAEADSATTDAQYRPQVIQSDLATAQAQRQRMIDQTANEIADLAIKRDALQFNRDKLAADVEMALARLDADLSQVGPDAHAEANKAISEAISSTALADRAKNLADKFAASEVGGWGWASTARDAFKGSFGGQDPVTALRQEYQRIVNSQAVKNLPPGPASDKDIQLALQGFPPANAGKDHIVSFLRGMEKMQRASAQMADNRATWVSKNGSLGPARRAFVVDGWKIPAGMTFLQQQQAMSKLQADPVGPDAEAVIARARGGR